MTHNLFFMLNTWKGFSIQLLLGSTCLRNRLFSLFCPILNSRCPFCLNTCSCFAVGYESPGNYSLSFIVSAEKKQVCAEQNRIKKRELHSNNLLDRTFNVFLSELQGSISSTFYVHLHAQIPKG